MSCCLLHHPLPKNLFQDHYLHLSVLSLSEILFKMKFSVPLFLALATASAFVQPSIPFVAKNNGVSSTNLFMGEVTPKTIKKLRDLTGAGMMDCKKALLESEGDQEVAADALRKKGLAQADKKASRVAAEGKIVTSSKDGKAILVEVNCETDFVAKDGSFIEFCDKVAGAAIGIEDGSVETLMGEAVGGETLEETRQAMVSKIGENIQVRRMAARGSGDSTVGAYIHLNKIGVLVEMEGGDEALCTDIAMHVAAMNPPFATSDEVPADVLEKERKLLTEQALESGKPAAIVEKMVEGRIRKYLEEICLVSQPYVKDSGMTVGKLLEDKGAKMIGFTRITVGEGIEKKEEDFAAEVAKMTGGSA
jgi:elongation factor Ts